MSLYHVVSMSISLAVLAFATYTDLTRRIIPNWVTYLATILGIMIWLILGNYWVLAHVVFTFLLAYFLYRLGLWAGGDVKLFTALAALNPFYIDVFGIRIPFSLALLLASVFSAFFLSFPWMLYRILRESELRRALLSDARVILTKSVVAGIAYGVLGFLGLIVTLFPRPFDVLAATLLLILRPSVQYFIVAAYLLFLGLFLRVLAMRVRVFRKTVSVNALSEGDVPADFVLEDGSVVPFSWKIAALAELGKIPVKISPLRAAGLTDEDIEWLRKRGIEELSVRTTMPFVPFVAAGYLLLLFLIYYGGS